MQEGSITKEHIVGEIGELLAGDVVGRSTSDEITLFKSVGAAVEDLCATIALFERASLQKADFPRM